MSKNYIKDIREKVGDLPIFMPCAGAFIYKDGKVLLQRRRDSGKWAMNGGSIELGETILEALERELIEEINIKPIRSKFMGVYSGPKLHHVYPNGNEVYIINNAFIVEDYEVIDKETDGEVIEVKWFNIDDLPTDIHTPDILPFSDLPKFIKNTNVIVK